MNKKTGCIVVMSLLINWQISIIYQLKHCVLTSISDALGNSSYYDLMMIMTSYKPILIIF